MGRLYVLAVDQPSLTKITSTAHWVVLIDPKKQNRILSLNTKPYAFDLYEGSARLLTSPNGLHSHSLLKIHVADIKQPSLPQAKQCLSQVFGISSETWLSAALVSLQDAGLIQRFSTAEFLRFASDAVDTHRKSYREHVEEIDYIALLQSNQQVKQMLQRHQDPESQPEPEKRKSFMGFWISSPGDLRKPDSYVTGAERQGDPYGGLM